MSATSLGPMALSEMRAMSTCICHGQNCWDSRALVQAASCACTSSRWRHAAKDCFMTRASDDAASPSARARTCPSLRRRVDSCATHASAAARHSLRLSSDACACSRPLAGSVRGSGQQPRRFDARRAHAVAPCKTMGCSRRRRWHARPKMHSKEGPDRGASARLLGVHSLLISWNHTLNCIGQGG